MFSRVKQLEKISKSLNLMLVNLLKSKTTIALQNKVVEQFNTPFLYFTSDGAYLSCHLPVLYYYFLVGFQNLYVQSI